MSSLVRPIKGQTGVILVTTLLLLILLTGVALTSLATLGVNLSQSQNLVSTKQAFQLAEAGVQYAEKYLNQHQTLWSTYASPTPQTLIPSTTLTGLGTFTVSVQDGGNSSLQVTSTGTASNNAQAVITGLVVLGRSEEHTSELQSLAYLVCRLLLEKKKIDTDSSKAIFPR